MHTVAGTIPTRRRRLTTQQAFATLPRRGSSGVGLVGPQRLANLDEGTLDRAAQDKAVLFSSLVPAGQAWMVDQPWGPFAFERQVVVGTGGLVRLPVVRFADPDVEAVRRRALTDVLEVVRAGLAHLVDRDGDTEAFVDRLRGRQRC